MRNKSTLDESLPSFIRKKLERQKTEGRLINKKDLILNGYLTVRSAENIGNKKLKVILEVLNFACLEYIPVIPQYAKLISEVFRVSLTDGKGIALENDLKLSFAIKLSEIDQFCYPLVFGNNEWKIAENFSIENGIMTINSYDWSIVMLIKEPPNEIITINPTGGIIYSELDKVTCLRVPKGNFKQSVTCKLQFVDMTMDKMEDFNIVYEEQLLTFINISQLFLFQMVGVNKESIIDDVSLRRSISIKIPLPDWMVTHLSDINFDTKTTVQDQRKAKLGFYVLQKIGESWYFYEGNLNFTQNSLALDTKHFGSFIFVKCRENREIRLCQNMILVENLQTSERGVTLVFLWMKKQNWYLWIELTPVNRISSVRESLESNGFVFLERSFEFPTETQLPNGRRRSRNLSKKDLMHRKTIDLFEGAQFKLTVGGEIEKCEDLLHPRNKLFDEKSHSPTKEINKNEQDMSDFDDFDRIGKRKVKIIEPEDEILDNVHPDISYQRFAHQSNAVIVPIKPKTRAVEQWNSLVLEKLKKRSIYKSAGTTEKEVIKVPNSGEILTDIDEKLIEVTQNDKINAAQLSDSEKEFNFQCQVTIEVLNSPSDLIVIPPQNYSFFIPTDTMKEYFNVLTREEIEEIEYERLKLANEQVKLEEQRNQEAAIINEPNKAKTVNYRRIETLSHPRTKSNSITRDPKIISSKSMLALASVIRQGLTLAVYLSLPDNVIAGIGFDSLSQMSMNGSNNTTYKVLVTWKKMTHLNRTPESLYVEQLIDGLRMIGYENLSILVRDHWKENKDITVDDCQRCLLMKRSD